MELRWFGQSAFLLTGKRRVFIDPFGAIDGPRWNYPPISGIDADLLLITHEHVDHNAEESIGGSPVVIRSKAGTFESPVGEVLGIASEHDDTAGTRRGANAIYRFTLDGLRICHLGDLGQPALRPEQIHAIGEIDVLFVPVGGGPTADGATAARVVQSLRPRLAIPMHYRTPAIGFLDPPDAFLAALPSDVHRLTADRTTLGDHLGSPDRPGVVVLDPPTS